MLFFFLGGNCGIRLHYIFGIVMMTSPCTSQIRHKEMPRPLCLTLSFVHKKHDFLKRKNVDQLRHNLVLSVIKWKHKQQHRENIPTTQAHIILKLNFSFLDSSVRQLLIIHIPLVKLIKHFNFYSISSISTDTIDSSRFNLIQVNQTAVCVCVCVCVQKIVSRIQVWRRD